MRERVRRPYNTDNRSQRMRDEGITWADITRLHTTAVQLRNADLAWLCTTALGGGGDEWVRMCIELIRNPELVAAFTLEETL